MLPFTVIYKRERQYHHHHRWRMAVLPKFNTRVAITSTTSISKLLDHNSQSSLAFIAAYDDNNIIIRVHHNMITMDNHAIVPYMTITLNVVTTNLSFSVFTLPIHLPTSCQYIIWYKDKWDFFTLQTNTANGIAIFGITFSL